MRSLFLLEFAPFALSSPSLAIVCYYWAAMSLVAGYAIGGGTSMMTIVHIGVMNDAGPTEQMDIVSKQRIEEKPSGKEFRQ